MFLRFADRPSDSPYGWGQGRARRPSLATPFCSPQTAKAQANPTSVTFSQSLTVSDDAEAERLFAALSAGRVVQVSMAPTTSRLGLVADRFGVPWMVASQNATR
jgi:uncharacterized glyoxalase superfamily protein PhnB